MEVRPFAESSGSAVADDLYFLSNLKNGGSDKLIILTQSKSTNY